LAAYTVSSNGSNEFVIAAATTSGKLIIEEERNVVVDSLRELEYYAGMH
jgi:uncharacterized protein (DUF1778 family)